LILSSGAILSNYFAAVGGILIPVIGSILSNAPTYQGPVGIKFAYMPSVAVDYVLRSQIPEDLAILIPAITAVDKFIHAVAVNIETSDLVVVGIAFYRVI
jgi:hypothetical protein